MSSFWVEVIAFLIFLLITCAGFFLITLLTYTRRTRQGYSVVLKKMLSFSDDNPLLDCVAGLIVAIVLWWAFPLIVPYPGS